MTSEADGSWAALVDDLASFALVSDREPHGLVVTRERDDGTRSAVEIVMTSQEWYWLIGTTFGSLEPAVDYVREQVLEQPADKNYLVYSYYNLVPFDRPELPVSPVFAFLDELAERHPEGVPGAAWVTQRKPARPSLGRGVSVRSMRPNDVPAVVEAQEAGAVIGLAAVFPQDEFPFPREAIARRWLEEIASSDIECLAVRDGDGGEVIGFAALRGDELMHFGIAPERWGTGAAQAAHDAVLERMRSAGVTRAWLRVFTGNERARRFYERLGWTPTGERSRSTFAPCPELLQYERELGGPDA